MKRKLLGAPGGTKGGGTTAPLLCAVSISEISEGRVLVERDLFFTPDRTISAYADAARAAGRITV